jgi:hypothetical protein
MNIVLIKLISQKNLYNRLLYQLSYIAFHIHTVFIYLYFIYKPPQLSSAVATMDRLVFKLKADSKQIDETKRITK